MHTAESLAVIAAVRMCMLKNLYCTCCCGFISPELIHIHLCMVHKPTKPISEL